MRGVADTNIVVSGLLWNGRPRDVLDAARAGHLSPFTTAALLAELQDVLPGAKFADRLKRAGVTVDELVVGYGALATLVQPAVIEPVITADPDDDAVLACAVGAHAKVIVSGDPHLLHLREYRGIRILTAVQLLAELAGKPPTQGGENAPSAAAEES